MSNREASIRLSLKAGSFLAGIGEAGKAAKKFGDEGAKAAQKLGAMGMALNKGLGAGRTALADLGSQLKGALKTAATLGGAFSLGAGAKQATELVSKFKDIAFAIRAGTGKALDYRDVQRDMEAAAQKWGQSIDGVTDSFKALYDDVGDVAYAKAGIDEIAKTATATGIPMKTLTTIVGQLNEKFGIGSKDLPEALAATISISNKGGVSVEDLGEKIGMLGATAKLAGLQGKEGLQIMAGMLNIADASTGNFKKSLKAVTGLMEQLGDPGQQKNIEKTFGVKVTGKTGEVRNDALQQIMQATGGKKEVLAKVFKGEQLKLMTDFGKVYGDAFGKAGGTAKDKTKAATDALNAALKEAGKSALSAADVEKEATARLQDPKQQLQLAMNTLAQEFSKPDMIKAFQEIAKAAPPVAKALAKVAEFTLAHPYLAGGLALGGKVGAPMVGAGAEALGGAAAPALAAAAAKAGPALAAAASSPAVWKTTGGVIGAAAAGFLVGKALADLVVAPEIEKGFDSIEKLNAQSHQASIVAMTGTREQKVKALAELKANQAATAKGGNVVTTGFGWLTNLVTGGEVKTDAENRAASIAQSVRAQKELEASLSSGGDKVQSSLERGAAAIERAAARMDRVKGAGGGNGLPPAPGNNPGHGG